MHKRKSFLTIEDRKKLFEMAQDSLKARTAFCFNRTPENHITNTTKFDEFVNFLYSLDCKSEVAK